MQRSHHQQPFKAVVYGARDPKAGCCGSLTDLFALPFNHHPVIESGRLEDEAQALLQDFFCDAAGKTEEKAVIRRGGFHIRPRTGGARPLPTKRFQVGAVGANMVRPCPFAAAASLPRADIESAPTVSTPEGFYHDK